MEGNGLSGRIYSNAGVGMLGLDIPLHPSNQPQIQIQKHPQQMMSSNQQFQQHEQQQTQLSMKQPSNYIPYNNNPNSNPNLNLNQNLNQNQNSGLKTKSPGMNSDEDEPNDHENITVDGKRKAGGSSSVSPWQRMKWTDNMVRLLIMAVYYIGDEAGNDVGSEKKKPGTGGASSGGGMLQKKGKWKSVSRAMMEKGFYVSPQQCEDKFNDLNKRYKRVNDILGKGTACNVVENQALLESMDLTPKMKEEVRKLLNSKHLFFREMCAYHNSCAHGTAGATAAANDGTQNAPQGMPHQVHQQQPCSHSDAIAPPSIEHNGIHRIDHEDDDDEDDFEDDFDEDDEDEDEDEEDGHGEGERPRKRARTAEGMPPSTQGMQQLNGEIMGVLQDRGRNPWEKKHWMKAQILNLEEQGLKFQYEAYELEKQRLKWASFSGKKERQMEKLKLENQRKRLEAKRMVLMLKQKETELTGEPNPSCVTS